MNHRSFFRALLIGISSFTFSYSVEAQTMPTEVRSTYTGREIGNVAPLDWASSGQTTFCGALNLAANSMRIKSDYATLMGDSALAFRVRWWRKDGGAGWCPSSPVGEFSPWDKRAADSLGLKLTFETHIHDGKTAPEMAKFAERVKASMPCGRC